MNESIQLPYKFTPRDWQLDLFYSMRHAGKTPEQALRDENIDRKNRKLKPLVELPKNSIINRGLLTWHRRAGKDIACLNFMIKKMYERVGVYFYCYPEQKQGKKAIWENVSNDKSSDEPRKYLDFFPSQLISKKNDTELKIVMENGSIFQIIGTENIDSIRSTNPVGVVLAEFAYQSIRGWEAIAPILRSNGGWALFNSTPNGKNHFWTYNNHAKTHPDRWFYSFLTVEDTGLLTKGELIEERELSIENNGDDSVFRQEWYCSFEVSSKGSFYGHILEKMEKEGRMVDELFAGNLKVDTYWDIGYGDATAIWFIQVVGQTVRVLNYYEMSGETPKHFAMKLQEIAKDCGYVYGHHYGPHDLEQTEIGTGKTRLEQYRSMGINLEHVPDISREDGIDTVRNILPQCMFDRKKCKQGIEALNNYSKEWDEKGKCFRSNPRKHHWANHGSDAFRYMAVGVKFPSNTKRARTKMNPYRLARMLNSPLAGV